MIFTRFCIDMIISRLLYLRISIIETFGKMLSTSCEYRGMSECIHSYQIRVISLFLKLLREIILNKKYKTGRLVHKKKKRIRSDSRQHIRLIMYALYHFAQRMWKKQQVRHRLQHEVLISGVAFPHLMSTRASMQNHDCYRYVS